MRGKALDGEQRVTTQHVWEQQRRIHPNSSARTEPPLREDLVPCHINLKPKGAQSYKQSPGWRGIKNTPENEWNSQKPTGGCRTNTFYNEKLAVEPNQNVIGSQRLSEIKGIPFYIQPFIKMKKPNSSKLSGHFRSGLQMGPEYP